MNANKPRAPGSTKEIVDELVDIAGGPKQVAFILGMHPSTIAAYMQREHDLKKEKRKLAEQTVAGNA